ncbi:MAG: VCBS repeat-containing protein, partial [Verrucomicrobiae bacterium]|nr:VCBS repeat-containing protein [Verrucomicrobiae bacterium]
MRVSPLFTTVLRRLPRRWHGVLLGAACVRLLGASLEPIPNQVLVEGMPTVRLPVRTSDPDGSLTLTVRAPNGSQPQNQNLRLALVGEGAGRMLELTPISSAWTSPAQFSVTLTQVSGDSQSSIRFVVVVKPRDFSPTGAQTPSTPIPVPNARPARFLWSDVNADGYPDLTSHGIPGIFWTPALGGRGIPSRFISPVGGAVESDLTAVAWADLDGNGSLEAFASGAGAVGIYWLPHPGLRSNLMLTNAHALIPMTVEGAAWADLDGNGSLDLVYSGVTRETRAVVLALNDGLGRLTPVPHDLPPAAGPVVAADFDQDGRPDLLLCNSAPGAVPAQIHFNRGAGTFAAGPVVAADHPVTGAGVADVDGDGVPDLWLVQAVNGDRGAHELSVLRQRAGRFIRSFHLDAGEFATAAEPAWGDLDHDGRMDFVAPYRDRILLDSGDEVSTNYFAVYHNQGDGRFARGDFLFRVPAETSNAAPSFVPAMADVDLDGDLDVVGHEQNFRVFYNQERKPNVPPEAPSGLRSLVLGDEVFLFWSPATDANQSAPLTYNVRAGTAPGTNDLVASQSLASGLRQLAAWGNAGFLRSFAFRLPRQDLTRIYWTVQAVDASYSGGPFAGEQTIEVHLPGNQPPTIQAPSEETLLEDTPATLNIGVADDRTPPEALDVRVHVDPEDLLSTSWLLSPDGSGAGALRRLRLSPAHNSHGLATVTLTVTDRNGAATT